MTKFSFVGLVGILVLLLFGGCVSSQPQKPRDVGGLKIAPHNGKTYWFPPGCSESYMPDNRNSDILYCTNTGNPIIPHQGTQNQPGQQNNYRAK
jgi:hypothetical protein